MIKCLKMVDVHNQKKTKNKNIKKDSAKNKIKCYFYEIRRKKTQHNKTK